MCLNLIFLIPNIQRSKAILICSAFHVFFFFFLRTSRPISLVSPYCKKMEVTATALSLQRLLLFRIIKIQSYNMFRVSKFVSSEISESSPSHTLPLNQYDRHSTQLRFQIFRILKVKFKVRIQIYQGTFLSIFNQFPSASL